ncbi:Translation elongation factor P Lys34--(R)-beta-lysine ligase [Olavius sp. associated proteobacterium Delta 1]|nr:Translation elongation factor P Lys34--(R)-beta-lysine ligase [Olavius sp. associated proteobacterium Delta 1]
MSIYRQSAIKTNLYLRSQVIQAVRRFFIESDYLEVDTPIRIPAPAPEAHIDAVATEDQFLQPSPEMCMKQLLAAGFPRIFQICKCFRHHERGRKHLPELTMLEWYQAGSNYFDLMQECERLVCFVAHQLDRGDKLIYRDRPIELAKPWLRLSVTEAFNQYGSISMNKALATDSFDEVMALDIEPNLGDPNPVFLYDYPARHGALARLKPQEPLLAERFELYIAGIELCNGFSELTGAVEQRDRFEKEQHLRQSLNKSLYPMPEKFLAALADMPDAGGNALGIDRLVMLFADTDKIDDVVTFTPEEL